MSNDTFQQLPLFVEPAQHCHFKGCTDEVVGSSIQNNEQYVCKEHNALEWARSLAKNKRDGYWRRFGEKWLEELEVKKSA